MILKQLIVSVRRRDIKITVKYKELRLKCEECNKNTMWNVKKVHQECDKVIRCDLGLINNNN